MQAVKNWLMKKCTYMSYKMLYQFLTLKHWKTTHPRGLILVKISINVSCWCVIGYLSEVSCLKTCTLNSTNQLGSQWAIPEIMTSPKPRTTSTNKDKAHQSYTSEHSYPREALYPWVPKNPFLTRTVINRSKGLWERGSKSVQGNL